MRKSRGGCWSTSAGCSTAGTEPIRRMPLPLAVQLYTFRDPVRFGGAGMGLDPETLEAIAAAGFLGVETVDVPGGDPVAARRVLADCGLAVASAHTWTPLDDLDAVERAAAEPGGARLAAHDRVRLRFRHRRGRRPVRRSARRGRRRRGPPRPAVRLPQPQRGDGHARGRAGHRPPRRARMGPEVDLQVDIFWVRVGGADPAEVIDRLGSRIVSLHVKDGIDLPRSAGGGEAFVNVPVGDGVVDPAPAIAAAERQPGSSGSSSNSITWTDSAIEAVRRSHDHLVHARARRGPGRVSRRRRPDRPASGSSAVATSPTSTCRAAPVPSIELAACADLDAETRRGAVGEGRVPGDGHRRADRRPDDRRRPQPDPADRPRGVSRAAIAAGKHVYTEKPLATTRADAEAILADAAAAGVRVGGAPDTFLGGGLQTARALLDDGSIGQPILASAAFLSLGPERWHRPASLVLRGRVPARSWMWRRTTSPRSCICSAR